MSAGRRSLQTPLLSSQKPRMADVADRSADLQLGPVRPAYLSADQLSALLKEITKVKDKDYLRWVSEFVSKYERKTIALENPAGARWKIGGLEDTVYKGNDGKLIEWGKFYLPNIVNMEVVGVVEGPYQCGQLVLMTCDKKKLYTFDGEVLSMVAENLKMLVRKGLKYPSPESYYKREAFEDMGATGEVKDSGSGARSSDQLLDLFNKSTNVEGFVSENKHQIVALENPAGAMLKIGGLEDTDYNKKELNGWGKFYLPNIVKMEVVGVVEGTSCLCDQLVLMTCEDRKLYAFDGEEEVLHMVAENLEELGEKGLKYPSPERYYKGEAFKDMTEKDWDKVRKGKVGKKLDKEHRELVETHKIKLLENLLSV